MRHTLKLVPLLAFVVSCGGASASLPQDQKEARQAVQKNLAAFENPGLVIGEFPLAQHAVVDGDTIHVAGLDNSLRLLADDTEETFKHENERRAYEAGWESYLKNQRGSSPRPVKMATPMGDEAKVYAEDFFKGVDKVTLERDDPKEIRDYYNRYLAYVFIERNGKRLNYNVEVVRAGYSPYFSKYGYSRRFHDEFVQAEKEARAAHRGIWDPSKQHYPDYDERKQWWDGRAEFVKKFEEDAKDKLNYLELTNYDAPKRLEENIGKEVVLLGVVSEVKIAEHNGPTIVTLSRRRGSDFPLVFFDRDVFVSSGIAKHVGEYVRVKGFVNRYENQRSHSYVLQIKIDVPSQIVTAVEPNLNAPTR
jgi:endonuclease YncB( thermonuclease family)